MTKKENHCPKCNGLMERGFILDHSFFQESLPRWVEGEPSPGSTVPGGLGSTVPGGLVGKKMRRVNRAERCFNCGYLEFYTSDETFYG